MVTLILITLWLLAGGLTFHFANRAWQVYWYRTFKEHIVDESKEFYNKWEDLGYTVLLALGGVISAAVILIMDASHKDSKYYLPNSLWMLKYDKEKVEKAFGTPKQEV